jgi:hypothetical protein
MRVNEVKIYVPAEESERPMPVEIRIVRGDCFTERDLPAQLSRTAVRAKDPQNGCARAATGRTR